MTHNEQTAVLCLGAALLGYWWAKRQACTCNQAQATNVGSDPMAWLHEWSGIA